MTRLGYYGTLTLNNSSQKTIILGSDNVIPHAEYINTCSLAKCWHTEMVSVDHSYGNILELFHQQNDTLSTKHIHLCGGMVIWFADTFVCGWMLTKRRHNNFSTSNN